MAKPPRMTAPKLKPVKPTPQMTPKATLGRAARVQGLEAGESRLAKSMPPKNKPATSTMSAAAKAATQAAISRAQRVQGEEAGESILMKRKPPQVIRTTVNERTTPMKKGR